MKEMQKQAKENEKKLKKLQDQIERLKRQKEKEEKSMQQKNSKDVQSGAGKISVKAQQKLTQKETDFLTSNIPKLTLEEQRGIIKMTQASNSGQSSDSGVFEFELDSLPYEVALKLYKFVK